MMAGARVQGEEKYSRMWPSLCLALHTDPFADYSSCVGEKPISRATSSRARAIHEATVDSECYLHCSKAYPRAWRGLCW